MNKIFMLLLLCFFMCPYLVYAEKFEVTVVNDIKDAEDPIRLKTLHFSIGKVVQCSHQEGEEIGKEFKIKVNLPSIQHMFPGDYMAHLKAEGKELDSITLGNGKREFTFTLFLGHHISLNPIVKENITVNVLGSSKGFRISNFWNQ